MFDELRTLEDVQRFVAHAYSVAGQRGQQTRLGKTYEGPLRLAVAEPGPLIEHAVRVAGSQGLTRQELRGVFWMLGKERWERGVGTMRAGGRVVEASERRLNRVGRPQQQVVFRWAGGGER